MTDYRAMYLTLLDASERALEVLEHASGCDLIAPERAIQLLTDAQCRCEEIYIETSADQ